MPLPRFSKVLVSVATCFCSSTIALMLLRTNRSAKTVAAVAAAAKAAFVPRENLLVSFSIPERSLVAFLRPLLENFVMKLTSTERPAMSAPLEILENWIQDHFQLAANLLAIFFLDTPDTTLE